MTFITASISKSGGREINQDNCGSNSKETAGIWVVADGLGGHKGGEIASELAVQTILNTWDPYAPLEPSVLERLILSAQDALLARQAEDPLLTSMRTTLLIFLNSGDQVLWGHVGDTRLYHFRDCAVEFQTRDHSVPQSLADAGEITREQIRKHADRNRILRAVGTPEGVKPTILGAPIRAMPGDAFLLCTDGFWEYITETLMAVDLAKSRTPEKWLETMELRLITMAEPGHDNYSAMAIFTEL